jgi:protein involved in polysaccharide export with SLBB domain
MAIVHTSVARSAAHLAVVVLVTTSLSLGYAYLTRPISATIQLVAHDRTFGTPGEAANFAAMATSTGALARVAAQHVSVITPRALAEQCTVKVAQGQPMITVSAVGKDSASARMIVDALAKHVARCADDWVAGRSREVDKQLSAVQKRLRDLRKQFSDFDEALLASDVRTLRESLAKDAADRARSVKSLQAQLSSVNTEEKKAIASLVADRPALRTVQQELDQALSRYTDEHPRVKELRASIIALQKESASRTPGKSGSSRTNALLAELNSRRGALRDQLKKAEAGELKSRQVLQKFATNEIEFARLQSEYNALGTRRDDLVQSRVLLGSKGMEKWQRSERVEFATVMTGPRLHKYGWGGGGLGLCLGAVTAGMAHRRRRFIRTTTALSQVTGLPVLAALPDLSTMDAGAREYWAIETLKCLRSTAGTSRHGCLVCGFISANSGEGCSTWIDLLAKAGLRSGNRVLVISQPDISACETVAEYGDGAAQLEVQSNSLFTLQPATASESHGIARYTVAGNPSEARFQKYWERAFATWQQEEDALVLVELPSASKADALVLSSAVPHVVWVSSANTTETRETMERVTSLKKTGCNLIGAVLNRASAKCAILFLLLAGLVALSANAQEKAALPLAPIKGKPAPPSLAPWQQRLTLGPGDVFDVSLYGQPDSLRPGIIIGPDGRMSYLQARDVEAAGLTIDELRTKLEGVLVKFHLAPRVVVVPVAFHSKKYFLLGNVVQPGAFTLDKPTTIVEAVAQARGFVSTALQRSSFTLADLTHAFLVRRRANGEFAREAVDFEKLFLHGELQENRTLAPDDYLYFPPLGLEDVYVLGEVASTGVVPYTKDLTVLGAIAGRGGFKEGAYRQKILIIRGSLDHPEAFAAGTNGVQQLRTMLDAATPETTIVDTAAALRATVPDFALRPRDIVYVSRKPWAKAEELLEAASSDFVRALVVAWTGQNIKPFSR